jgi:hypothetical protein
MIDVELEEAKEEPMSQQALHRPPVRPMLPSSPARGLALDLFRGAILGDFDQHLGTAGAAAQSVVGFIPVVGTVAALRDLLACIGQRDPLGIILNLLAIFPVFGGLAKTADALHALHRYQRAAQRHNQEALSQQAYHNYTYPAYPPFGMATATPSVPHRSRWVSFGLSLLVAGVATLYGLGVRTFLEFLRLYGPTVHGYALHGDGAWLAAVVLLPVGLLMGLIITLGNRLWLGLVLFPLTLLLGFRVYLMWW